MRHIIVVDEPAEYEKWYASQKSWLSKNPDYAAKLELMTDTEGLAVKTAN